MASSSSHEKHDLSLLGSTPPSAPTQVEEFRPPPPYTPYLERSSSLQRSIPVPINDGLDSEKKINPPTTKGGFQIRTILIVLAIISLCTNLFGIISQSISPDSRTVQDVAIPTLSFLAISWTLIVLYVTRNGNQLLVIFMIRCLILTASVVMSGISVKQILEQNTKVMDNKTGQSVFTGTLSFMLVFLVWCLVLAAIELKFLWIYAYYLLKVSGKDSIFVTWRMISFKTK